jgi:hypothetical protein
VSKGLKVVLLHLLLQLLVLVGGGLLEVVVMLLVELLQLLGLVGGQTLLLAGKGLRLLILVLVLICTL